MIDKSLIFDHNFNMNKVLVFIIIIGALFFHGCKSTNVLAFDYYEQERIKVYKETENILLALGYTNPLIFVYCHSSFDGPVISKELFRTSYEGLGFYPEGPPGSDPDVMPTYNDINMHGSVVQNVSKVNYDNTKKPKLLFSYISILIIIDDISITQKEELLKLFRTHLLNNDRTDVIYIISKKDHIEK